MKKGKLITVWNPIDAKMGATTTAIGIATALSWWAYKKTLLTSIVPDGKLELYLSENVKLKYTLDHLKIFQDKVSLNEIQLHTTAINNKLDAIGGYHLDKDLVENNQNFTMTFIEETLKEYDYLVIDVSNKVSEKILEKSDLVLALVPFELVTLKALYKSEIGGFMKQDKVIPIFNKLPLGLESEIEPILAECGIREYRFLPINKYVHYSAAISYTFYDFLVENLNKTKQIYMEELGDLTAYIMTKVGDIEEMDARSKIARFFKRKSS